MSSRLMRGAEVPAEPMAWKRVSSAEMISSSYLPETMPSDPDPGPAQETAEPAPVDTEHLLKDARRQGFEEGQAAARQSAAAQIETMQMKLARTVEELTGARLRYRREAEQDVVALALAVARRILHRELTVAPEALLGLVKAALEKMEIREVHRARVSREDAPMVRKLFEQMGVPQHVEVIADAALSRGGLVIESSRGMLDASVDTQLAEIERGFADLVRSSP